MKKILKTIYNALVNVFKIIASIIVPILHVLFQILNTIFDGLDFISNIFESVLDKITKLFIKLLKIEAVVYFFIFFLSELGLFIQIIYGTIPSYSIDFIVSYSLIILVFTLAFISIIKNNKKFKNKNLIFHIQILFYLPLIYCYWIASIKRHDILIKNLNTSELLSIFNTLLIYFSACFIGLITLYKKK